MNEVRHRVAETEGDPERKRQWEREHREQRNARRRALKLVRNRFLNNSWPNHRLRARRSWRRESFTQSCGPVRDQRERVCAGAFHAAAEEEFLAIGINVKRVGDITGTESAGVEKQFRTPRLWHTVLLSDLCYIDLILV